MSGTLALRIVLLVLVAAGAVVALGASLNADRERTTLTVDARAQSRPDPGIRVLICNRGPPVPVPAFASNDLALRILQPVDVVTPDDPSEERHLTLKAGSMLKVNTDMVDGLILNSGEWGRDIRWPVTRVWIRPQRLDRDLPAAPVGRVAMPDPRTCEAADHGPVTSLAYQRTLRNYRGTMEIRLQNATSLLLINHLPMEAYVEGVVASEMAPGYPIEALKTQAVVSRTYGVARLLQARARTPQPAYDLVDGLGDQDYNGSSRFGVAVRRAVMETRGVVMTVRGASYFLPMFCASSGGSTASSDAVVPGMTDMSGRAALGRTVMRAAADPASIAGARAMGYTSTHGETTVRIKADAIRRGLTRLLRPRGVEVGYVRDIRVAARDYLGRAVTVVVSQLPGDPIELPANEFRLAVTDDRNGRPLLRSTLWTTDSPRKVLDDSQRNDFAFTCTGLGHGAGMSQVGAWWMAREGAAAQDILNHYYGGNAMSLRAAW